MGMYLSLIKIPLYHGFAMIKPSNVTSDKTSKHLSEREKGVLARAHRNLIAPEAMIMSKNKQSKWAKIAHKAHTESPLKGLGNQVIADSKEFRDGFLFRHDQEE